MQIEDEIQKGILPDPSQLDPITGEPLPQEGEMGAEGDPAAMGEEQVDPELQAQAAEIDKKYMKDTKTAEL